MLEQYRIDFEFVIKNEELVVDSAVLVEEFLGQLFDIGQRH